MREGTEDDIEHQYRPGFTLPIRLILGMWCLFFLPRCTEKSAQAALMLFAAIAGLVYWPGDLLVGWSS